MKPTPKIPAAPPERHETVRHRIIALLEGGTLSAREISSEARVSEKEVYDHLEHIRKTRRSGESRLVVTPAECGHCGFVFTKRDRVTKPGRCPACRGESIREPLFSL